MTDETTAYRIEHSRLTSDTISAADAHRLYDQAAADPRTHLTGDVEHGFAYRVVDEDGLHLGTDRVEPLPAGDAESGEQGAPDEAGR